MADSGASALCLAYARLLSGDVHLGLVTSWCKTSKSDVEAVMRFRADPFFMRPLEIGSLEGDALFAQAVSEEFAITEAEIEASTIVVRGFEGKRKPPVAIAFVRLDGIDSAIANYVDGLDLSNYEAAMKKLAPGKRVRVVFQPVREGRITDFAFECAE